MNLSGLSNSQIEQAIEKMQKGIEIKPNSQEAIELQRSIDRALEELQRRAQKKSEELTGNTGQLPKEIDLDAGLKEIAKQEWPKIKAKLDQIEPIPILPSDLQSAQSLLDKWAKEKQETRVIGTIEDPTPVPIPVVAIGFKTKEGKTEIRRLTQTDILTLLKTYFKRVATSAKMESKRYSEAYDSDMGKMVYKLFQGWNMIYNETQEGTAWPPLADVFPGLSRASQQQKVNAEILWRWASNDK